MKTLFIFSNASLYGGAEKCVELLLGELAKAYKVYVFAEQPAHLETLRRISGAGVIVIELKTGLSPLSVAVNLFTIRKYVGRLSPDIVWANTNKAAFLLALCSLFGSIRSRRLIVYLRDFQWAYLGFILSRLKGATVFAPSRAVIEDSRYEGIIGNGVAIEVVPDPVSLPERELVSSPGFATDAGRSRPNYVLCVANILRLKGIDHLLRAFAELPERMGELELLICGSTVDEVYSQELKALGEALGLGERVRFLPFQAELGALYENALFVVSSSISRYGGPETLGRTIIEAWAHGRAVIAFDVGGPRFVIENGTNGLLVAEGDATELSKAMARLIESDHFREELGRNGLREVEQSYETSRVAATLLERFSRGTDVSTADA